MKPIIVAILLLLVSPALAEKKAAAPAKKFTPAQVERRAYLARKVLLKARSELRKNANNERAVLAWGSIVRQERAERLALYGSGGAVSLAVLSLLAWFGFKTQREATNARVEKILGLARLAVRYARQIAKRDGRLEEKAYMQKVAVSWAVSEAETKEHRIRGEVDWAKWTEVALGERHF